MSTFPVIKLSCDRHGHFRLKLRRPKRISAGTKKAFSHALFALSCLKGRIRRGLSLADKDVFYNPQCGRGVVLRLDPESGISQTFLGPGFMRFPPNIQYETITFLLRLIQRIRPA